MRQFRICLDDGDVADVIIRAANPRRSSEWQHAVETAVATGRGMGKREGIEALDDGLRAAINAAVEVVRQHDPGRNGLIHNLERLDQWLQRYPHRGRPVEQESE